MKKLVLAGAIALFGLANAQMQQGNWMFGATTGAAFNNNKQTVKVDGHSEDSPSTNTFSVTPQVGYFVINNLAVTLDLGLTTSTTKDGDYKLNSTSFAVMPGATYFFNTGSKLYPFVGANVGYATKTEKETYASVSEKTTIDGLAWKGKAGVMYMVTPSIGLSLGVAYGQFTNKETVAGYEVKTIDKNLDVNVGFSFFLNGNKTPKEKK